MLDCWDEIFVKAEFIYGPALAIKLSDLIDQGKVDEANAIIASLDLE